MSRIPVLKHYKGVCHVYVDQGADPAVAEEICFNAKVQRPGVCNAMETLLVHQAMADRFLPAMGRRFSAAGRAAARLPGHLPDTAPGGPGHRSGLAGGIPRPHSCRSGGSGHGGGHGAHRRLRLQPHRGHRHHAIFSGPERFLREVDASVVLVNASTRFNDGGQLGLGAEIGISTYKLHAFGPMGVDELTTTKFVVFGDGHVRQ